MSIEVRGIRKTFGSFTALAGVDLVVPSGELVALVGPSGSGKTSLLRIIAGLEQADEGRILFEGEDTSDRAVRDRGVGFVFQHYALFRHMTIFENVAFGLRVKRTGRPAETAVRRRVEELLKLVQLDWLADRYPSQLSGGQRQRIALARALAVEPKVLLLDEPFGSLDAAVRQELRRWLRRLHDEIHVTSVFVTHDQEEALEVADRVAVMNKGRIEQFGTPQEVFDHPATPFVMGFLGSTNIFHGRVESGRALIGNLSVATPGALEDRPMTAFVRPHDLEVTRTNGNGGIRATLTHANPAGVMVKLELSDENGQELHAHVSRDDYSRLGAHAGEAVYVRPRKVRVFPGSDWPEEIQPWTGEAI
jgi:sulfate transport system ATP-binding protein